MTFENAPPSATAKLVLLATSKSTPVPNQSPHALVGEIVVDSFAGGGGASAGIEEALRLLGRIPGVDIAINHNAAALAMHTANHPNALHLEADIWSIEPQTTTLGRPVGLLWASPDCRHFSKAKGSLIVNDGVRGLAWSVLYWAEKVMPRIILLENVEEFQKWGPLVEGAHGKMVPNPMVTGSTFIDWVARFKKLGYQVEWRVLKAADYGVPTIRRRLYIIMRRDYQAIAWPEPTHDAANSQAVMDGSRLPWVSAAHVVDWSIPCPSVLMTKEEGKAYTSVHKVKVLRPLASKTMLRIASGVKRFLLEVENPTIVDAGLSRLATNNYEDKQRKSPAQPIAPFFAAHYGADIGSSASMPMRTITSRPKIEPVVATLCKDKPRGQLAEKARRVADFLRTHSLFDEGDFVRISGFYVVDIGMRQLTPRELARAQGFAENYILDAEYGQGKLSQAEQRHKIGNSVCPPVASAIVAANYNPSFYPMVSSGHVKFGKRTNTKTKNILHEALKIVSAQEAKLAELFTMVTRRSGHDANAASLKIVLEDFLKLRTKVLEIAKRHKLPDELTHCRTGQQLVEHYAGF